VIRAAGKKSRAALTVRVAAYARISVADRDGSAFTSIEAQVDSVTSYIRAQAAQGWRLAGEPFVDDGFTGGNANRPGLQRLFEDVRAGLLDAVVVHRFDRFSRSQRDFLNLLHVLDEHEVAFVSVCETLDTGTPMGRCMLGVMTAFAQLERETIAARTKTKILAARRKGMWTGGRPVLGYDIVEKRLVVNTEEAERAGEIFELYLREGSLLFTLRELERRGWCNKSWTSAAGQRVEGRPFSKSSLHTLLRNPLYIGRIRAGDDVVEAQHETIVDEGTWQAVQNRLAAGAPGQEPTAYRPTTNGGLLQGLVTCGVCGSGYSYTYSGKKRRWRYLTCRRLLKHGAKTCPGSRVAAGEFEQFVYERIRALGRDRAVLKAMLAASSLRTDPDELRAALRELDSIWAELFPAERARVMALLIEEIRFDATTGNTAITFREGAPGVLTKP
jgi:site-specific DNA recombinase